MNVTEVSISSNIAKTKGNYSNCRNCQYISKQNTPGDTFDKSNFLMSQSISFGKKTFTPKMLYELEIRATTDGPYTLAEVEDAFRFSGTEESRRGLPNLFFDAYEWEKEVYDLHPGFWDFLKSEKKIKEEINNYAQKYCDKIKKFIHEELDDQRVREILNLRKEPARYFID